MRHFILMFVLLGLLCGSAVSTAGCAATPLMYSEMTEDQKAAEQDLQAKIQRTAEPVARIGMQLITDKDKRKELAGTIISLLNTIEKVLSSQNAADWQKALVNETAQHLALLTPEIQDIAQDAFDLFTGWINLPGLNDVLPDVIRDRLLAFVRGATTGLQSIQNEE